MYFEWMVWSGQLGNFKEEHACQEYDNKWEINKSFQYYVLADRERKTLKSSAFCTFISVRCCRSSAMYTVYLIIISYNIREKHCKDLRRTQPLKYWHGKEARYDTVVILAMLGPR
jgi:hypothetical protein